MVWCARCAAEVEVEADDSNGFSCCVQCGRVVEDTAFSSDVMFSKGADGEGELVGQMVGASGEARGVARYSGGRMWAAGGDGHEQAVSRGRYEICALVEALRISPSGEATDAAHRLYRLALQRGFTKGRRVNQVAAVCLYIFCRLERRPYMLIDFSDHLSVNVYTLGGVFLQMLRLLRLDDHATFTKPIDPSLFMNRFVDRLRLPTQELKSKVSNTAMRLVQSMKRDWMLTGRRPSGICGAALFLAAHIHGVEKTKKDVISIVHIGWSTVERRVMELAETRDAEMTLQELDERDRAAEAQREQMLLEYERTAIEKSAAAPRPAVTAAPAGGEEGAAAAGEGADGAVVPADPNEAGRYCEHVRAGTPLLAHGMCRGCLEEYLQVTMAVQQGANDPPAYLRNLRRDIKKRVRAQLAGESPMLALKASGEVLAIEGPEDDPDMDIHLRRHMENESVLEQQLEAEDGAGAGPSRAARGGSGGDAAEEADFDRALQSSDLQPLARALGGVAPAVASALHAPSKRLRSETPPVGGPTEAAEDGPGGVTGSGALAAVQAGGALRRGVETSDDEDGDAGGKLARAKATGGGRSGGEEDEEEEDKSGSEDHLSDVGDDEISGYLASREEATVREQLWTEMNKDWIEKQQAKKAAAAEDQGKTSEKTKRKYTRKAKTELPAAEDAAGATRSLLEAKKLSNKINYGALEDLFGGDDTAGASAGGSGGAGRSGDGRGGFAAEAVGAGGTGRDEADAGAPTVAAALAKRAAARARGLAEDEDKYSSALEEETRRRGGLGGGGGGGGGFLDSLTFARNRGGSGADASGRARPQGLSLRPRGLR